MFEEKGFVFFTQLRSRKSDESTETLAHSIYLFYFFKFKAAPVSIARLLTLNFSLSGICDVLIVT